MLTARSPLDAWFEVIATFSGRNVSLRQALYRMAQQQKFPIYNAGPIPGFRMRSQYRLLIL